MDKYKLDLSEVRKKRKYVLKRLNKINSDIQKEKMYYSLMAYFLLKIANCGIYTKFYNMMNQISKNKFSLSKQAKYEKIIGYAFEDNNFFDVDYLTFLFNIVINIIDANIEIEDVKFKPLIIENEELVKIAGDFYKSLNDNIILSCANKVFHDENSLNMINKVWLADFLGITVWDPMFKKAYCNIYRNNTIIDIQTINHEIMHGVDYYMHEKLPSRNYSGFQEVPTYTIDYLLIDFLKESNFDKKEVEKLVKAKDLYLFTHAYITFFSILNDLSMVNGSVVCNNISMNDIFKIITSNYKTQLLEVLSGIMAYGLYKQMEFDKEVGISNLKKFMLHDIPVDRRPDFSNIGLSDDYLLELSRQFACRLRDEYDNRAYRKILN